MNNFGIKQIGFHQTGTVKGGLQPQNYSGTWGNRGRGNELLSALENGLSWIGDKIINLGDYVDQGLHYLAGALPGGLTAEEALQDTKLKLSSGKARERGYTNIYGQYKIFPNAGIAPLPGIKESSTNISKWDDLFEQYLAKTKITAGSPEKIYQYRRATDGADRFISGKLLEHVLENSKDFVDYVGHGMTKGSDGELLARLRTILRYGTNPNKNFFTAPVTKLEQGIGSAFGTGSGHPYSDGPFMLLMKNNADPTKVGSISHVLINDGLTKESIELANKYKIVLLKEFPNVKHLLYSEIK